MLQSYQLGVNAYVVKPVDFLEFIKAVKLLGGFWAVVLALFLPMVVAAGGNSGGQAATMVIRAMALGEVRSGTALRNVIVFE